MNCNDAVAELVRSIENGTSTSDVVTVHLRDCIQCGQIVASLRDFQASLPRPEPDVAIEPSVAAAEEAVRAIRRRRTLRTAIGVAAVLLAALGIFTFRFYEGSSADDLGWVSLVAVFVFAGLSLIAVVLVLAVRNVSRLRLYKRLRPGRELSGVCLGIAERFGWKVGWVRFVFFALIFFDGLGFWLYILLDLILPIHPADRAHLLRFRIQRWWRARHAEA